MQKRDKKLTIFSVNKTKELKRGWYKRAARENILLGRGRERKNAEESFCDKATQIIHAEPTPLK